MKKKMNDYLVTLQDFLDSKRSTIEFCTGGTTDNAKIVSKRVENVFAELKEIFDELNLPDDLEFVSTTTPEHFFGFTFYAFAYKFGYKWNLDRINYPEDLNFSNAVLVTTPSFLEVMRKHNSVPNKNPKIIIVAGSKLEDKTFQFAKKITNRVIEIYGSTETGVIAYREDYLENLKIFPSVQISDSEEDLIKIKTPFSINGVEILNDRIEVIDGRIKFLGRNGRVLKIQEKRIDAEVVESVINDSCLVQESYCLEYSGKMAALVVLSSVGNEYLLKKGSLELIKFFKSELRKSFDVVPQKWRFVNEIPRKETGKYNKEKIKSYFDANLSLPLVISKENSPDEAVYELCFHRNSNFFKGHFDGFPILPGVVQLFYASYFVKEAFNLDCHCGQIRKIKFANIIRPDEKIYLELIRVKNGVSFKYFVEEKVFSSGILPEMNLL